MSESSAKKQRRVYRRMVKKMVPVLVSNFTFRDRIRFVFTKNFYKPLHRTLKQMNARK